MDRDSALRKARAAHQIAVSPASTVDEADAATKLVAYLVDKFKLSEREVTEDEDPRAGGGCDALPIGVWGGEEMFFLQAVIGVAGGALSPDPFGTAWLAGPKIALPRLRALADRLLLLYRTEGEKIDRRQADLSDIFERLSVDFESYGWGPAKQLRRARRPGDKISLWVGLTQRLIERLLPPAPRSDSTCTALVTVPRRQRQADKQATSGTDPRAQPEGTAPAGGREYPVMSAADYQAGRHMADQVLLGEALAQLPATPAHVTGRRGVRKDATDIEKSVASVSGQG